ncbi:MAG TPA: VWA domain-containing protein [Terriglobales bacterium]|nr:VWA domain-containing protein [Terriglobales bacterium]
MKLRPIAIVVLVALACSAQTQQAHQNDVPTFRTDVRLVNVYATVLDRNGSPVADLTKNDFQVLEDGVPQTISVFDRESELPLNIVVAIDTSLSTRKDLPLELTSARHFAHDILRPQDRFAVYRFDENVSEVVPFTSDLKTIDRGLDHMRGGAATSLFDAVYLAGDALAGRRGRKALVIITDGGDTTSQMSYQDALRSVVQSEALVYSVIVVPIEASAGRDIGGEHALIQFSRDTGGKYFYAGKPGQLDDAFHQIDRELRTQYVLAYYPKPRNDGAAFRRIDVRVKQPADSPAPGGDGGPAFTVRHRSGYYTH